MYSSVWTLDSGNPLVLSEMRQGVYAILMEGLYMPEVPSMHPGICAPLITFIRVRPSTTVVQHGQTRESQSHARVVVPSRPDHMHLTDSRRAAGSPIPGLWVAAPELKSVCQ
jgi:hypothetical protein